MRQRAFLMATIASFFYLACVEASAASLAVGGTIAGDTTWTSTDTIVVTESITVTTSGHLTIQAGAVIMFRPYRALSVEGELTAHGESADPILFTATADTIGGSPSKGSWSGIILRANSVGTLSRCDVRYSVNGVYVDGTSVALSRCVIKQFSSKGIYVDGHEADPPCTASIEYCSISQDTTGLLSGTGIHVYRSVDVTLIGCEISDCLYGLGFNGEGLFAPQFQVIRCDIHDHMSRGIAALAGG